METDEMTRLRGTLSRKGSKQPGLTRSVLTPRHLLTLLVSKKSIERTRNRREFSSSRERSELSIMLFPMLLIGLARQKLVCANRQASKSPPAEGSLASPDASPGIATWRSQPCVRRCSFGALRLISVTDFSPAFS
ncbi:hypothetical protein DS65_03365 [Mesotoga sp. SC_4PWL113PWK15]|nr:hypothetical protein DS65_03365 [Mesotoga sp. SC_4PWL113PWK15]